MALLLKLWSLAQLAGSPWRPVSPTTVCVPTFDKELAQNWIWGAEH